MYGFKKGAKPKQEAPALAAGMIRGQGTGTSDSIPATIPRGSYIMPADSTAEIGHEALTQLGARGFSAGMVERASTPAPASGQGFGFKPGSVHAKVSNGEHHLSPEQVHAVGAQVLDQVRDATHTPAGFGFKAERGELYFADGGLVDDEERPRGVAGAPGVQRTGNSYSSNPATPAPSSPAPAAAPVATAPASGQTAQAGAPAAPQRTPTFGETQNRINEQRAERTGTGLYGTPRDPAQRDSQPGFLDRAAPNTMTAIRGAGDDIAGSYKVGGLPAAAGSVVRNTMVPAIGFAADVASGAKTLLDPAANALKTAVTGDPTPIGQEPGLAGANAASTNPAVTTTRKVPGKPNGSPPGAPIAGTSFDEWQSGSTQQQRDTAGDAYRNAWQQQAPGGLRRAGQNATALYNAEQQVRGTGITAQRGANGQMTFSGDGTNALPQSYTQGVDLAAGNESMARANAIRDSMLQGNGSGAPGGGAIADSGTADANATLARWGSQTRARVGGRDGREERALDLRERELTQSRDATAQGFGLRARELDSNQDFRNRDLAMRGQELGFRADADRERLGLERQRTESELQGRGFQNRAAGRLEALQSQFEKAGTPEERAQLAEQIRVLSGREAPNRYTVVPGGQEWDQKAGAMRTLPSSVINNQTGQLVEQPAATRQPVAPRAGDVIGGYRFTGGNPADQSSWQKV